MTSQRYSRHRRLVIIIFLVCAAAHITVNILFVWKVPYIPVRWFLDVAGTIGLIVCAVAICLIYRARLPYTLILSIGLLYFLAKVLDMTEVRSVIAAALGLTLRQADVAIQESFMDTSITLGFATLLYLLVNASESAELSVEAARNEAVKTADLAAVRSEIAERKRAEELLRESEERFRQMAEHSQQIFWLVSADMNTLYYVNPAYEHILGRSCDSLYTDPRSWLKCVHADDREDVLSALKERASGRRTGNTEITYRFQRGDQTVRWLRVSIFPVFNEQGEAYRLAGLAEDITERRNAEESRRRLQEIVEATPDLVGIADVDGRFLYMNCAGRSLLGFGENEDLSKVRLWSLCRRPATSDVIRNGFESAVQKGVWRGETLFCSRRGFEIPVSQVLIAHKTPAGDVEFVSTVARDITERVRAEKKLAEAHDLLDRRVRERTAELNQTRRDLEHILNSAGEGILGVDRNGAMMFVNPAAARMTGWEPDELIGRDQHATLQHTKPDGKTCPPEESPIYAALRDGTAQRGSIVCFWRKDGSSFPVEFTSTPIREGDQIVGAVVVFVDISERQMMEEALRHADRLASIGTLAAGIAHELNNPLSAILSYAETALRHQRKGDDVQRVEACLEGIKNSTLHSANIVKSVLQFSRQGISEKTPQDLCSIVRRAAELTHHPADRKEVSVQLDIDSNVPTVVVNPTEIEQVLVNVINNAIQASSAGQAVSVGVAPVDDTVRVVIQDRGEGMQPEQLKHIFDPFYTTRQRDEGTGLGLSISHGIVAQHGGSIDVASDRGHGTTVTVTLPIPSPASQTGSEENPLGK